MELLPSRKAAACGKRGRGIISAAPARARVGSQRAQPSTAVLACSLAKQPAAANHSPACARFCACPARYHRRSRVMCGPRGAVAAAGQTFALGAPACRRPLFSEYNWALWLPSCSSGTGGMWAAGRQAGMAAALCLLWLAAAKPNICLHSSPPKACLAARKTPAHADAAAPSTQPLPIEHSPPPAPGARWPPGRLAPPAARQPAPLILSSFPEIRAALKNRPPAEISYPSRLDPRGPGP